MLRDNARRKNDVHVVLARVRARIIRLPRRRSSCLRRLAFALAVAARAHARPGRHARRIRGHRVRQPRRADDPERHDQIGHAVPAGAVHAAVRRDGCRRPGSRPASMTLPAFCRVEATARPTSDSDIKFEVWIPPAEAWNGKFEGVGNGGYSGAIGYAAMATALRRGYAVASTDTGHTGDDMKFGQGHPEKVIDWAYRSVHVMTETSKLIVRDRPGPLRRALLFRRLLVRRPSGAHRSAALSRRLRRHRRRRSGQQPHPPDLRVPPFVDRDARQGRQADHPADQAAAADQGGGRGVRRASTA